MENKKTSAALPVVSVILLLAAVALLVWIVLAQPGADGGNGTLPGRESPGGAYTEETFENVLAFCAQGGGVNLRVTASGDGKIHLRYPSSMLVSVNHDAESAFLDVAVGEEPFGIFRFWGYEEKLLEVALPEMDSVEITLSSGNAEISRTKAGALFVKTTSGDIDADHLEITGHISLDSASGNVTCVNFYTEGIAAASTSGDIRLEQAYAGEISLSSTSGNQSLRAEMGALTYFYTNSGNVDIQGRDPLEGWVRTTSGDVTVRMPYDPQTVAFSSSSGVARVQGGAVQEKKDAVNGDQSIYEIAPGGPTMEVYTESGDLTLR